MNVPTWPEYTLLQAGRVGELEGDARAAHAAMGFSDDALVFTAETVIHGRHARAAVAMRPEALNDTRFDYEKFVREELGTELARLARQ